MRTGKPNWVNRTTWTAGNLDILRGKMERSGELEGEEEEERRNFNLTLLERAP